MANQDPDRPRLIVGLGNPGREYVGTRHNVGFEVVNLLARRWQVGSDRTAFDGLVCDARPSRQDARPRVYLLKPMTYMNRSGRSVQAAASYYRIPPADVLVVMDEMALEPNRLRLRTEGSAGGHNGLADVLRAMGSQDVPRLRIGIGRPPGSWDAADYVLSRFRPDEQDDVDVTLQLAADAAEDWVFRSIEYTMEQYNRKPAS